MQSTKDPDGFTGLGQRWFSMKPQTSHPFGLVVKCVLESHPIAPVFNPHVPWTGRWGSIQLNQGVWRLLRGKKKPGISKCLQPKDPTGLSWTPGPCFGFGWGGELWLSVRVPPPFPAAWPPGPVPAKSSRCLGHWPGFSPHPRPCQMLPQRNCNRRD